MLKNLKYWLARHLSKVILPRGLYCFNYHRVGEANLTEYDPNVFSCDVNNFSDQILYLKKNFTIVTISDIPKILEQNFMDKKYALITFDDGYVDNYTKAFPILEQNQVSATFFLATNFINNVEIPWWDKIAYLLRNTKVNQIKLNNWPKSISLYKENIATDIKQVLDAVKVNNGQAIEDILEELEEKLQIGSTDFVNKEPLFMTWDMAREMKKAGMDFGSQTCSHRIMSHLSRSEQEHEAKTSKDIIEKELGDSICAFAYPVGGKDSFTPETINIIKQHYELSFSFISGINTSKSIDKFCIERVSVDGNCNANQLSYRLLKLALRKIYNKVRK